MKFIKHNFGEIAKLFIYQIGMSAFALLLYISVNSLEVRNEWIGDSVRAIFSMLSIIFYSYLVFVTMRELGAKDRVNAKTLNALVTKNKATAISLLANMPIFLISASALIFILVYAITGHPSFLLIFSASTAVMRLISAMYIGVVAAVCRLFDISEPVFSFYQTLLFFIAPMFSVALCEFSYRLGLKKEMRNNIIK